MRVRRIHPTPPLTIPVAEETLSLQIADMQMLEDNIHMKGAISNEAMRVMASRSYNYCTNPET